VRLLLSGGKNLKRRKAVPVKWFMTVSQEKNEASVATVNINLYPTNVENSVSS